MDYRCMRCQNVGKIGVSMLGCTACNAVYHIQCLGWNFLPFIPNRWYCPRHWASSCRICAAQNILPQEPQRRCFSCGSLYCGIHSHTSSTPHAATSEKESLFACAYCLDENAVQESKVPNKRKQDEHEDDLSLEREKKRLKITHQGPTTAKLSLQKEKKTAISVEVMNQIISSMSPSAPPLHIQTAPVRKKKRADVCETPDQILIKQLRDTLVAQHMHQKDLADILEVSPSTISSYFNNKMRSNGWKELEAKLSEWIQNSTSGSGEVPSKSDDSPSPVPDSHWVAPNNVHVAQSMQRNTAPSHSHQAAVQQTNMTPVTYESGTGKVDAMYNGPPNAYFNVQSYAHVANVYQQQNVKLETSDAYGPDPNEKAGYYTQANYQAAVSGYNYPPTSGLSMMDGFQVNPQLMQRFGYRGDPSQNFNMNGNRQSGLQ